MLKYVLRKFNKKKISFEEKKIYRRTRLALI